jgi:predicted ATP-grasp superfamily ATP-dependent carboligase
MERERIPGLLMDVVPGPDSDIYAYCAYLDQSGAPVAGRLLRKLRQTPPGFGDARVAEIVDELPSLREATVEIARRMGLRGIVSAEFKRDSRDGRFRFLEINGRSMGYNGLLRRAGLDLAGLAWSDHMGNGRPAVGPDWRGVWIHLHPDLLHSALENRRGRMGFAEFLAPYRRPKVEAVWSSRDPRPFAAQWSRSLNEGARALRRGRAAELFDTRTQPPLHAPDTQPSV